MKKLFVIILALSLLLCACGKSGGSGSSQTAEQTSAEESAVFTKSVFESIKGKIAEPELRRLFDGNLDCERNIFRSIPLPHEFDAVSGTLCYVTDRFATFAELKEYVNNIYCAETAKELLESEVNGHVRYCDYEGRLCYDQMCASAMGYYVDWSDYSLTVELLDDTECYFTVAGTAEYPADEPKKEPYALLVHAVCEDGVWKLEKTYS